MWAMVEFMTELANRSPHLCDLLTGAIMFPGREFWFEERVQQNYKEGEKKRMRKKTKDNKRGITDICAVTGRLHCNYDQIMDMYFAPSPDGFANFIISAS